MILYIANFQPGLLDQSHQTTIGLGAGAFRFIHRRIKTTEAKSQHSVHNTDLKFTLVIPEEAILYLESLAENAGVKSNGQRKFALQLLHK